MDFDGTTRGPVKAQALGAAEGKAKRPAGSGERGSGRTFEARGGDGYKLVAGTNGQKLMPRQDRQAHFTGDDRREALVRVTLIRMGGLRSGVTRNRIGVGSRRVLILMHVMTEMLSAFRKQGSRASVRSCFKRVAHVAPCRIGGIERQAQREDESEQETHDGADSNS